MIIGYISIVKCNWISVWIYTLIIVIGATIVVRIVSPWQTSLLRDVCVCVFVCFLQLFLSWRDGMCANWYWTPKITDEEREKRHKNITQMITRKRVFWKKKWNQHLWDSSKRLNGWSLWTIPNVIWCLMCIVWWSNEWIWMDDD